MVKNNFHALLTSASETGFLQNLDLSPADETLLISARDELRDAITSGFNEASKTTRRNRNVEQISKPRFAMQGSRVYKTLNSPAYPPIQQVDLDLGVYLPFTTLGNGQRPKESVTTYFRIVKLALWTHLAQRKDNQWRLIDGKKTCVRVQISDYMHIDLPLYAVPETEISRVKEEAALQESVLSDARKDVLTEFEIESRLMEQVDPTVIHMANLDSGWVPSDALVIRDWVSHSCKAKGLANAVRPICRYLKAWRDVRWPDGSGPSSIFLLAACITEYEHVSAKHCDLLERVIEQLPNVFERPILIPCPTPDDPGAREDLRERVSSKERVIYTKAFVNLREEFSAARSTVSPEACNQILQRIFGSRMPMEPERVTRTQQKQSKAAIVVKSAKPRVEPLRTTPASTTG